MTVTDIKKPLTFSNLTATPSMLKKSNIIDIPHDYYIELRDLEWSYKSRGKAVIINKLRRWMTMYPQYSLEQIQEGCEQYVINCTENGKKTKSLSNFILFTTKQKVTDSNLLTWVKFAVGEMTLEEVA